MCLELRVIGQAALASMPLRARSPKSQRSPLLDHLVRQAPAVDAVHLLGALGQGVQLGVRGGSELRADMKETPQHSNYASSFL